jgi:hypothetical protein
MDQLLLVELPLWKNMKKSPQSGLRKKKNELTKIIYFLRCVGAPASPDTRLEAKFLDK